MRTPVLCSFSSTCRALTIMEQELSRTQQGRGDTESLASRLPIVKREREREAAVKRRMEMREEVHQQVH